VIGFWNRVDSHFLRREAPGEKIQKTPKSNRHRRADMTPELVEALAKFPRVGETVFCNADGAKLWAAQRKVGLGRIKWHELRRSFASIVTSGGAPLVVVQSLLGHSTIQMTERYAHLAPGKSAALCTCSPRRRARAQSTLDCAFEPGFAAGGVDGGGVDHRHVSSKGVVDCHHGCEWTGHDFVLCLKPPRCSRSSP
jgi:hypothetical protein